MFVLSFVSQKGGVAKSTLSRAVACEASKAGLSVKLADLDTQQGTSTDWHRLRLDNGYNPVASVEIFSRAADIQKNIGEHDLLVIDGTPRASKGTLETAKISDLVVLPTCTSRDDLVPSIKLAYELEENGISRENIVFALTRVSTEAESVGAREYISQAGFTVLDGCLYEKPAYRRAQDQGLSVTETQYKSLRKKADVLLESLIQRLGGDSDNG